MSAPLRALRTAVDRLAEALGAPETSLHRDASIQRFEFCFELSWRSIQDHVRAAGLDCRSPKGCVKLAFQQGWIEDEQRWLAILDDRNLTSHTYDEATAAEIYGRLPDHLAAFRALVNTLEAL